MKNGDSSRSLMGRKNDGFCTCDVCVLTEKLSTGPYVEQEDTRVRINVLARMAACEMVAQKEQGHPGSLDRMVNVFAELLRQELAWIAAADSGEPTTVAPVD